uniref:BPI fold containing family B member 6 n=1 Tax=Mandrillus leucophaeus TaxID=9568 RepID=A0A2K6AKU0_MANLE
MLRILCLALCSLLTHARADPGALLRLGMDIMNKVQSAMDESHILEKMAAEAGKKQPGMKPIKGITNLKVKDVQLPIITLNFVPGVGIFQCVSTGMTITGKMCPAIDAVLVYVNRKWTNLSDPMPVGQMGTIKYVLTSTPATTASYIQLDFSPVVQQQNGKPIKLADAGEALVFPKGHAEGSSQLLLPDTLLSAELALLQKSFHVNVQDTMIGELPPQTTETLAGFIPEVSVAYPKSTPLTTQIKIKKPPKVTMKTGKSLLHFHGTLEMFAAWQRGKAPMSLFLLEVHFNLKVQYSVRENRLQMATSLDRLLSLSRKSSSIGNFNEKELTGFITDYLEEAYIPVVNDVLQVGLPLPDFLAMNYNLAELDVVENALMLDLKLG